MWKIFSHHGHDCFEELKIPRLSSRSDIKFNFQDQI